MGKPTNVNPPTTDPTDNVRNYRKTGGQGIEPVLTAGMKRAESIIRDKEYVHESMKTHWLCQVDPGCYCKGSVHGGKYYDADDGSSLS